MNIDWFTFVAQIVNFLILVMLLRWLLYGPIVRAMQRREAGIANRLEEAEQRLREADEKAQQYDRKNQAIDAKRQQLLDEARRDAQQESDRLRKDAHERVQSKRAEWLAAFEHEREELLTESRRQAGRLATEATRRTLQQLADASLEEQMCAAFTSRLRKLDDETLEDVARQLDNGKGIVSIRSTFDMPDQCRDRLQETVGDVFGKDAKLSFETSPELVCGFELDAGGYIFGWNVNEFVRTLEHDFNERLTADTESKRQ